MNSAPRILLLRLSSLGDVVLSTAALDAIRARSPRAQVTWVVAQEFAELLRGDPRIHRLVEFDRKKSGFWVWHRLVLALAQSGEQFQEGFDEIIDLHATLRTRYARLVFWLRSKRESRWRTLGKPRLRRLGYFVFKRFWPKHLRPESYALRVSKFAADGHGVGSLAVPALRHLGETSFSLQVPQERRVCLMPGAAWEGKRLPPAKWLRLMGEFPEITWLILGKPGEKACETLYSMATKLSRKVVPAFRELDLVEQAKLISASALLVGNDTGMGHIAEALGTPTVTVFGPTRADLGFGPRGSLSRAVESSLWCSPCSKDGRACFRWGKNRFSCQRAVPDSDLAAAIRASLKREPREISTLPGDVWAEGYRSILRPIVRGLRFILNLIQGDSWSWRNVPLHPIPQRDLATIKLIWLHAASAGELEMLWPVAEELSSRGQRLGLSVFSASGRKSVERFRERFAPVYAGASPWEGEWREFFEAHLGIFPSAVVTSKYEAWPELWGMCAEQRIPLFVLNADDRRSVRLAGRWVPKIFGRLPELRFATVDHDSRMRLEASDLRRGMMGEVEALGDPRWDRVAARIREGSPRAEALFEFAQKASCPLPWGVIGSAWIEDLERVIPAWKDLGMPGTLWVVPHAIRGPALERQARFLEGHFPGQISRSSRISEGWKSDPKRSSLILVDELGVLVELYSRAQFAWVGGGFRSGLHSVIEPAFVGIPVACGPRKAERFPEVPALLATGQLRILESSEEIRDWLCFAVAQRTGQSSVWEEVRQLGAGRRCADWILEGINAL